MSNAVLAIESKEIEEMNHEQLAQWAEQKSRQIVERIETAVERAEVAKRDAEDAKNIEIKWYQSSKKKVNATSDALVKANEAIADLHNLVKEAIQFSQTNTSLSNAVQQALSKMIKEGITDANGQVRTVSQGATQFVEKVQNEASRFATRQRQVEQLQAEHASKVVELQQRSDQADEALREELAALESHYEANLDRLSSLIDKKVQEVHAQSAENDEVHDRLLAELKARNAELGEKSDANDAEHTRLLSELEVKLGALQAQVEAHKPSQLPIVVSLLAFGFGVASLVVALL